MTPYTASSLVIPWRQGDVHMAERGEVDHSREPLSGLVERVTFHSAETGFCVLRVKVRGHR